jgi:catechol 2,3-dioxygenase-like lactoylglutathione lyase family enzyme
MAIIGVDIGFVSATDALVSFYRDVFGLEALEPRVFPDGTVHRLALGNGALKVMVPIAAPEAPVPAQRFWDRAGMRYVTMWLDDLDATVDRWTAHGGTVALGPLTVRPGVRTALLTDPDGNTVEAMQDEART